MGRNKVIVLIGLLLFPAAMQASPSSLNISNVRMIDALKIKRNFNTYGNVFYRCFGRKLDFFMSYSPTGICGWKKGFGTFEISYDTTEALKLLELPVDSDNYFFKCLETLDGYSESLGLILTVDGRIVECEDIICLFDPWCELDIPLILPVTRLLIEDARKIIENINGVDHRHGFVITAVSRSVGPGKA